LLTAGISDADASTRATSSITMQVATESALVSRTPGPGDDHLDAPARGGARIVEHAVRLPVRRDDADLERDVELGQRVRGRLHHRPVAVAAHDQPDPRALIRGHG
jgi:hypothetical protein